MNYKGGFVDIVKNGKPTENRIETELKPNQTKIKPKSKRKQGEQRNELKGRTKSNNH